MLKVIGAGLPRTGTASLCQALRILGYRACHHSPESLPLFPSSSDELRVSEDWEAVADAPWSLYWRELADSHRSAKVILTVRDVDDWFESMKRHANKIRTGADIEHIRYTEALHSLFFCVPHPCEYWYKRRFREHNQMVVSGIARRRLLVMDIVGGHKWDVLCPFLGVEEPDAEWPWENRAGASS